MLDELNDALKSAAAAYSFPSNIEIVTKYWDKIDAVLAVGAGAVRMPAPKVGGSPSARGA